MDKTQAIELIKASDLEASEKQRLTKLLEDKDWNDEVQKEILAAIQKTAIGVKQDLDEVTKKTDAVEQEEAGEEIKQASDEAEQQMDEAVSEYNLEMAKLEQSADDLVAKAKKEE